MGENADVRSPRKAGGGMTKYSMTKEARSSRLAASLLLLAA